MTRRYHANNFYTTLSSSISASATTMTVSSVTGLPSISTDETYRLTITSNNTREIVTVTSRSSNTLTVTRAQEGTTALAFPLGAIVELRATANSFDRKADMVATSGDVLDFGDATSLEIPNNSSASLTAEGQIALDTSVTDFADGLLCYRAGSTDYGVIAVPKSDLASPTDSYVVTYDASTDKFKLAAGGGGGGGSGDVVGPASATDNALARFDTTTGKLIQNSAAILDDNGNLNSNNVSGKYTTTATAGGTTTLSISSTQVQVFTGTTSNQTVVLPDVTTLYTGYNFYIHNRTTSGILTINANGGSAVSTLPAGHSVVITCIGTSFNNSSSWLFDASLNIAVATSVTIGSSDRIYIGQSTTNNSSKYVLASGIAAAATSLGTISTGTWNATTIAVNRGGTGQTTYTDGQLLIGNSSGNTLTKATLTAGSGISITNGGGSVTIAATGGGGGITWNTASGTTQAAAVNNGYVCTNASQCNVTLPATAAVGDIVSVVSQGAGGWKLTANTGQTIKGLNDTTTSAGNITHANQYDAMQVICVVADTTWVVTNFTSALLTFA